MSITAAVIAQAKAAAAPFEATTPAARWHELAQKQGASPGARMGGRPPANAQPTDISAWINKSKVSPYFAFPEWPWTVNGDTATAHYLLAANDGVTWTATSAGVWNYDHSFGGTDLDQIMNDAVSTLATLASIEGLVFLGMFLNLLQAAANHEPIAQLGAALKDDWDKFANSAQLAFSIVDGDWAAAWNHATQYGKDLSGLISAWYPGPAPDAQGNLTVTAVKTTPKSVPSTPTKAKTMQIVLPAPVAKAIGWVTSTAPSGQQTIGPPDAAASAMLAATPAPRPAAAVPWYKKKIVGPVTVGETGILAGAALALWKVVGK